MASRIVVFPLPVSPLIRNRAESAYSGEVKSIECSPFSEFMFLNLKLSIFIIPPPPLVVGESP